VIESDEELSHDGCKSGFVRFAVAAQTLIEVAQDPVVLSSQQCGHIQAATQGATYTKDGAFAARGATVAVKGSQPSERCSLRAIEGS
jgi:hypothetical protein